MPAAVSVRTDFLAGDLRGLAAVTKNANQSRRLLSLAAVLDGMDPTEAARIGGVDRQTLRDGVTASTSAVWTGSRTLGGRATLRASRQTSRLSWLASSRPGRPERTVGKILRQLGFSRIGCEPHPDPKGSEACGKDRGEQARLSANHRVKPFRQRRYVTILL
jgi:hypothetical protein